MYTGWQFDSWLYQYFCVLVVGMVPIRPFLLNLKHLLLQVYFQSYLLPLIWFIFPIISHFYYFLYFFYSLYLWFPDDPFALGFFARFFSISDLTIPLIEILDWILYCVKQLSSTIVSLSPRLFSRSQCSLMDQNVFVFTFQCDLLIIYPPNLR